MDLRFQQQKPTDTTRQRFRHSTVQLPGKIARNLWYSFVFCCLFLAACSPDTAPPAANTPIVSATQQTPTPQSVATPTPAPTPTPVAGCTRASPVEPGVTANQSINVSPEASRGVAQRNYRLHVPEDYQTNKPFPLVFVFHGYGGTASSLERVTGLSQVADQEGFFAVYPQGLRDENGYAFWGSIGPVNDRVDDAHFINNMLNALQNQYCIDTQRVYATGFSNGGSITAYLACRMADKIAAFAPVAAPHYVMPDGCNPGRAVSLLSLHGTGDTVVPYNSGFIPPASMRDRYHSISVTQWLREWATRNHCAADPTAFLQQSSVVGEEWDGCQKNAELIHYRLIGIDHVWPGTINGRSANLIIWEFFKAHPLPPD